MNEQGRVVPFWHDNKKQTCFDGCLRDEKQGRKTYRYVLFQSVRHGFARGWRDYEHTHVNVELEDAIAHAKSHHAFLEGVRYKRYVDPDPGGRA